MHKFWKFRVLYTSHTTSLNLLNLDFSHFLDNILYWSIEFIIILIIVFTRKNPQRWSSTTLCSDVNWLNENQGLLFYLFSFRFSDYFDLFPFLNSHKLYRLPSSNHFALRSVLFKIFFLSHNSIHGLHWNRSLYSIGQPEHVHLTLTACHACTVNTRRNIWRITSKVFKLIFPLQTFTRLLADLKISLTICRDQEPLRRRS